MYEYLTGTLDCPISLRPTETVAIIGKPKSGKTSILARMARNVAEQGGSSAFVSLEIKAPPHNIAHLWKPYANKIHWITGIHSADDLFVLKKNLENNGLDPQAYFIDCAELMAKISEGEKPIPLLAYLLSDLKEFAEKYGCTVVFVCQSGKDSEDRVQSLSCGTDQCIAIRRKEGPQPGADGLVDQELKRIK